MTRDEKFLGAVALAGAIAGAGLFAAGMAFGKWFL